MTERTRTASEPIQRKLAAILAADVVGYSKLAGIDEDRTLARLRSLQSDLVDPTISVHRGRVVKRTGDGVLAEFRSVVDAVRCAVEILNSLIERNAGVPPQRRIEFRIGIHLGDVVEEADGDLMGDGVNIAARLESVAKPGAISLSEDAYRQVKARLDLAVVDCGAVRLKNIADPMRVYAMQVGKPKGSVKPRRRGLFVPASAKIAALLILTGGAAGYFATEQKTGSLATPPPAAAAVAAPPSLEPAPIVKPDGATSHDRSRDHPPPALIAPPSHAVAAKPVQAAERQNAAAHVAAPEAPSAPASQCGKTDYWQSGEGQLDFLRCGGHPPEQQSTAIRPAKPEAAVAPPSPCGKGSPWWQSGEGQLDFLRCGDRPHSTVGSE